MASAVKFGSGFAVLALFPALKIIDDPVVGAAVSLLVGELHLLSGVGFLVLLAYIFVAEMGVRPTQEQQLTPQNILSGLPPLFGMVLGGGLFLLWIDAGGGFFGLIGLVGSIFNGIRRILLALNGGWLVYQDLSTYELVARQFGDMEQLMMRSPGRATRWPFYLFFTAITLSATIAENEYLEEESVLSRSVTIGLLSVFTGIFALVISHNYFPSADALPWRASAIAGWTALTAVCLVVYLVTVSAFGDGSGLPIVPTLVVTFTLGTFIATIDAFYPIPELLVIGVTLCSSVKPLRKQVPNHWSIQTADIHSGIVSTAAKCWEQPVLLFLLLPVANGTLLGGWMIYIIYWSTQVTRNSLLATLLVLVVFVPVSATAVYMLWFWVREIPTIAAPSLVRARPKEMLLTPALVFSGILLVETNAVLGVLLVLSGVIGVAVSANRFIRHDWSTELPAFVAVPIAYGFLTIPPVAVSWVVTDNTTLFIGTIVLFPLSLLPLSYNLRPRPNVIRLVTIATLVPICVVLSIAGTPTLTQFNNSIHAVFGAILGLWILLYPDASQFGSRLRG